MKIAVIKSSELGNRWDAGFHVLRKQYEEKARAIEKVMTRKEVIAMLSSREIFSTEMLRPLQPLLREQGEVNLFAKTDWRRKLLRAVREYPFLSMAVVLGTASTTLKAQQDALAVKLVAKQDELVRLQNSIAEISNRLNKGNLAVNEKPDVSSAFPSIPEAQKQMLKENRFVAGVVYCSGDELVIPVLTHATAWLCDCWVIPVADWQGPATIEEMISDGEVPIPVRFDSNLGEPVGYMVLPDHSQNYNAGWRL
jgi:hypothetical protein